MGLHAGAAGARSVYVGYKCGEKEQSNDNAYFGHQAGTVSSAGSNAFFGSEAGRYCSGTQNAFFGDSVCSANPSTAKFCAFFGANSGMNQTSGVCDTFIGTNAGFSNTEGSECTFVGQGAGYTNTTGSGNLAAGCNSGGFSDGSGNTTLGCDATVSNESATNQTVIGHGVVGFCDNSVTFSSNLTPMASGVDANFSSTTGGCLYPVSSSRRWKQDIRPLADLVDSDLIYQLEPVTYRPRDGHGDTNQTHLGLIAEDVDQVLPMLVPKDAQGEPASVRYSMISVVLLEAVKKLNVRLGALEDRMPVVLEEPAELEESEEAEEEEQ